MESFDQGAVPSDEYVKQLQELGFDEEMCYLALKISQNDKEQAVELLVSGGTDLLTLRALAGAKIVQEDQPKPSNQNENQSAKSQTNQNPFNQPSLFDSMNLATMDFGMNNILLGNQGGDQGFFNFGLESKMVIVWRQDKGLKNLPVGLSAQYASEAVCQAYSIGLVQDPVSVQQWELTNWAKISLKCKDENELLEIDQKAKAAGLVSYVLKKKIILPYQPKPIPKVKKNAKEDQKQAVQEEKKDSAVSNIVPIQEQDQALKTESDQTQQNLQQTSTAQANVENITQKDQARPKKQKKPKALPEPTEEAIICVVGPAIKSKFDNITSHLKLL